MTESKQVTNSALKVGMLYGATKSTKTSRLGDIAEWFYTRTGKPARGVFSDTGGYGAIEDLVEQGVIVPFVLSPARPHLLEDMDKLAQGWFPANPADPSGPLAPPDYSNVSALLFDGITSWGEMIMEYHASSVKFTKDAGGNTIMSATDVRVPEMPKDSFVKSGEFGYRFMGRSDYMGAQGMIVRVITNSGRLPLPVWWTATEARGVDEFNVPGYGPDFIGNKLTIKCGKWFGDLLHLDKIATEKQVDVGGQKVKVVAASPFLFTASHIDPNDPLKLPYIAGTRVNRRLWNRVPPVMEPDMKKYLDLVDSLAGEARKMKSVVLG